MLALVPRTPEGSAAARTVVAIVSGTSNIFLADLLGPLFFAGASSYLLLASSTSTASGVSSNYFFKRRPTILK